MDLIYTDIAYRDVGILDELSADFAWGVDENDFFITVSSSSGVPAFGSVIYSEDGTLGGMVRGVQLDGHLSITGVTWTGMLGERVLCPQAGQAYYQVGPCDASDAVRSVIDHIGLSGLFYVDGSSGKSVTHKFDGSRSGAQDDSGRYMSGWAAIWQLLYEHGLSISFKWDASARKVAIAVKVAADHTDDESMAVNYGSIIYKNALPVNHLICLGQGELTERCVIHLFRAPNGVISRTQTLFGRDEIAQVYNDSAAEDEAALESHGRSKLKELADNASSINLSIEGNEFDIGDIVGCTEPRYGIMAKGVITKKIVQLPGGSIQYETYVR